MAGHRQGLFTPKNKEKYIGDINKIRYLSSWELDMMKFLDNNPNILKWSSEPFAIPYIKPTDNKVHKYYPDFLLEYKNKAGNIVREMIEVKPDSQTRPPKRGRKKQQTYINEQIVYAINIAKWESCQQFCNKHNIKFSLLTEKQLFK